jgi:hypothetical protein
MHTFAAEIHYRVLVLPDTTSEFRIVSMFVIHVRRVPCHHCMAHTQIEDGGDALQIWSVAANILNKQSRTADKEWSSRLEFGHGVTIPHRKKEACYENSQEASDLEFCVCVCVCVWDERPKRKKTDMRFVTWSERSMYRAGSLRAVAEEISKHT